MIRHAPNLLWIRTCVWQIPQWIFHGWHSSLVFWSQATVTQASSELSGQWTGGNRTCVHGSSRVTPMPNIYHTRKGEELKTKRSCFANLSETSHQVMPGNTTMRCKCNANASSKEQKAKHWLAVFPEAKWEEKERNFERNLFETMDFFFVSLGRTRNQTVPELFQRRHSNGEVEHDLCL